MDQTVVPSAQYVQTANRSEPGWVSITNSITHISGPVCTQLLCSRGDLSVEMTMTVDLTVSLYAPM